MFIKENVTLVRLLIPLMISSVVCDDPVEPNTTEDAKPPSRDQTSEQFSPPANVERITETIDARPAHVQGTQHHFRYKDPYGHPIGRRPRPIVDRRGPGYIDTPMDSGYGMPWEPRGPYGGYRSPGGMGGYSPSRNVYYENQVTYPYYPPDGMNPRGVGYDPMFGGGYDMSPMSPGGGFGYGNRGIPPYGGSGYGGYGPYSYGYRYMG